jgi:2-oxoisovalerate dehydrogenase E2 component (dihydrolipoyl transacylase)
MPWVRRGGSGGGKPKVVPRQVTQLALSFDHRIIDGELGSRFLADIGALLHDPGAALAF